MIADGHRYEQILEHYPDLTYLDIFDAAAEAIGRTDGASPPARSAAWENRMAEIKRRHPRAYEKWDESEEETVRSLFAAKTPVREIAAQLQRQPGAIRARLLRLGVFES